MSHKKLSNGFAGSTTRSMEDLDREIESRITNRPPFLADVFNPTKMDIFTDDFQAPGTAEIAPGQDVSKIKRPFEDKHADFAGETRQFVKRMAAAGRAQDQGELDDMDKDAYDDQAKIKDYEDQYPGSQLSAAEIADKVTQMELAKTDEALWKKAKDASQEAFGKIKWPFVMWWYEEHGGK